MYLNFNRLFNRRRFFLSVFSCLILSGAEAVFANKFVTSYFEYTKEQQSDEDLRKGAILFVIPTTRCDKIEFYANGIKLAENIPEFDAQKFKKKLGEERYKAYMDQLQVKTDEDLIKGIYSGAEIIQLGSLYDDALAELLGVKFIDYGRSYQNGNNISYSAKLYEKGLLKEERKGSVKWGETIKVNPPATFAAKGYDRSAYVTWSVVKDDGILGYNIYYGEKPSGPFKKANETIVTVFGGQQTQSAVNNPKDLKNLPEQFRPKADEGNFPIKDLINEKKYYVQVRAQHFNRMESVSDKTEEVIPKLGDTPPPVQLNPIPKNESIPLAKVTWQKVDYAKLAYYNIYRALAMSGPYEKINQIAIPKDVTEYTDRGPFDYAKTYWYRVSAVSSLGNQGPSSAAVYFQPIRRIEPKPVLISKLEPKAGAMVVYFNKIDDKDIFKYYIMRSNSSSGDFVKVGEAEPKDSSYEDKKLDSRGLYCYRVKAIDKAGNLSQDLRPVCENPLNGKALDPPSGVNVYEDQGGVVIAWSYPKHGLLEGFVIYRSEGNKSNFKKISPQIIPENERLYIDKEVKEGQTYYYYIQTVAQNNVTGLPSTTEQVNLMVSKPQPVQNLTVYKTTDKSKLIITWDYFGEADLFIVEAEDVLTKKKIPLSQTKSKTFQWLANNQPKKGRYEITVRARKNGVDSRVSERNRVSFD